MKERKPSGPFFLGIETATDIGSVALFSGSERIGEINYKKAKSHASLLTPMVHTLLRDMGLSPGELQAVAVSKGPGSYTGLRVGVSTAKGLCLALGLPLISMSSLSALAYQVKEVAARIDAWICPMIDARRMEVYCSLVDSGMQVKQDIQATIIGENSFEKVLSDRKLIFIGDGAAKCEAVLGKHKHALFLPGILSTAASMGEYIHYAYAQGIVEDVASFEPFYLKDFVATTPRNPFEIKKKRRGKATQPSPE
ncbi:MAG: tRNA (adenosine(37)-N6)-threonylcarbamoyltransferase complex dimerization subunit type 1 TsaB [Bacteroidota bacterium]